MEKIIVLYWKERDLIDGYYHEMELSYSPANLDVLMNAAFEKGLSIMMLPNRGANKTMLIVYISTNKFGQY